MYLQKNTTFLYLTLFFTFLISSNSQEIITDNIEINTESQSIEITHQEKQHLFEAEFDKTIGNFIFLTLIPKDIETEYNHIYVTLGDDSEIPSYSNSDYKTVSKNNSIVIETENIGDIKNAKILIECKESCDFTFYYQIVNIIPLLEDRSFDLVLNSNREFTLEYQPSNKDEFNNKFTFFSNSPTDFEIKINYGEETIQPLTEFYNGYGLLINNILYPDGLTFTFKVNHFGKPKELIHISNRKILTDYKNLEIGDFHSSITGLENYESDCFVLPKLSEEADDKKYNLNFMTYTKNIKVTLKEDETNDEEVIINSESEVLQIDSKKYSYMCLSSGDNKIATATFQLLDGTEQTINQDYQMSLYRGVPLKAMLSKGEIAYYKLNYYLPYSKKVIMNLKSIQGKAKLYYGICDSYPKCDFTKDKLENLVTEKSINDNTFLFKDIDPSMTDPNNDPKFQTAIVYCPEDNDCDYYITLFNDNDEINLIEKQKFHSSIPKGDNELFQFNIYDSSSELKYLYLVLYSFTGNSDLTIYSDVDLVKEIIPSNYLAFGNKVIAVINANDISTKSLHGNYYIKVKASSNCVYSIYYFTAKNEIDNYYLTSNEVNIFSLGKDEEKNFLAKNKYISEQKNYFIEYESMNCELEVQLEDEEIISGRSNQFIINPTKSYYDKDYYEIKIKVKSFDINSDTNLCIFSINAGENSEKEEIILNDDIIQNSQLSSDITYINYLYPILPNDASVISVYFRKLSIYDLSLSYSFGEEELTTYNIMENEKKILFNKSEIKEKCKLNYESYCVLKIKLELTEKTIEKLADNELINFQLSINKEITYPTYLSLNNYTKNILLTNQYQYYYMDIGKDQEYEIIIDFFEGNGQALAKVVKKDEIEENADYLRRVRLPKFGMSNTIVMDQFSKNILINNTMTSECVNGCEIYIGILHSDQKFTDMTNFYSIYYREINKENNIIYLPKNNIIHGNLKDINKCQIFRTDLYTKDLTNIITITGENIMLYVNEGEAIPDKSNYKYSLDSNTKESLKITNNDNILTYTVCTTELNGIYDRSFYLKIDTTDTIIQHIEFNHNNLCHFDENNKKCHYILPIEKYIIEDKLYLFIPDNKDTIIYAKAISMESFDKLTPDEKIKQLPTKLDDSTNYLLFDISERKEDIYLLITIENINESVMDANLIIGRFNKPSSSLLRPETYNFYSLNKDENNNEINLIINAKNLYTITFYLINDSKGIIRQSQLTKKIELNNKNNTFSFHIDPELRKQKTISVQYDDSNVNDLYFYVTFELRHKTNFDLFEELEQKYEYLENNEYENKLPLSFYHPLNKNQKKNYQFLFQITDRILSDDQLKSKKLNIEGYIINNDFMLERAQNAEAKIPSEFKKITGKYDINTLTGIIYFSEKDIEELARYPKNYFYINLYEDKDEIGTFSYIEIDIKETEFEYVEFGKYVIHTTSDIQSKNILLVPEIGPNKMAIDFMMDGISAENYTYTINIYYGDEIDYSKNSTFLVEQSTKENGKIISYVYLSSEIHYIVFNVINKNNKAENNDYILKYRIESSNPMYYYLANREINTTLNGRKLHIEYTGVWEYPKGGGTYHDEFTVNYKLKFFDRQKLGNIDSIDSIYVKEKPLYEFNEEVKGDDTRKILEFDYEIEKNDKKEQIMQLVAYASYKDNEEILAYSSVILKYDPDTEIFDNVTEFWIVMFIFVGVILVSFGAVFVYLYSKNDVHKRPGLESGTYTEISRYQSNH